MEIRHFVDQRQLAIERFFAAHGDALARQGSIVATYRRRGNRRLGPYLKLTCRRGERQVAVYLGTDGRFIDTVRERLAQLQSARSERSRISAARRAFRRYARIAQQELDKELGYLGLIRQGHEVRGWRTAPVLQAPTQPMPPPTSIAGTTAVEVNHSSIEKTTL
jgi:hypothetical protein